MDTFSWTDSLRATVSTCLPCFNGRNPGSDSEADEQHRGSQARYEELEGLLRDVDDTDGDAETMSLHSNLGVGQPRRKKKRRHHKTISLFGYHLFGRPPIQLSDSEDETDSSGPRRRRPGRLSISQLGATHSSSSVEAFDSDASPLDPAVISSLSPQDAAARAARAAQEREAEEERRRQEQTEKAERHRRRQEHRELKRAAAALANGAALSIDGEEFEGFPGSGSLRPPFSPGSLSSTASPTVPTPAKHAGSIPTVYDADDPEDGEADFGGEAYVHKSSSRGSDSSRSHTQSQTSASRSNTGSAQYHPNQSQGSPLASPNNSTLSPGAAVTGQNHSHLRSTGNTVSPGTVFDVSRRKKRKSKRSSNSATTSSKRSSASPTSQSASLPSLESPGDTNFPQKFAPAEPFIVENGEPPSDALPDVVPTDINKSKFPITGFGGVSRTNSTGSGVFLARRGDD